MTKIINHLNMTVLTMIVQPTRKKYNNKNPQVWYTPTRNYDTLSSVHNYDHMKNIGVKTYLGTR